MPNLHPTRQVRKLLGNAVHLTVNLKGEKVNSGVFKKFVQLCVGVYELYLNDLNGFSQPLNHRVEGITGMEFLKNCLKVLFNSFLENNTLCPQDYSPLERLVQLLLQQYGTLYLTDWTISNDLV